MKYTKRVKRSCLRSKYNWKAMTDNSSEEEALCDFAKGGSYAEFARMVWSPEAKKVVKSLAKVDKDLARRSAVRFCNKYFVFWS